MDYGCPPSAGGCVHGVSKERRVLEVGFLRIFVEDSSKWPKAVRFLKKIPQDSSRRSRDSYEIPGDSMAIFVVV